MKNKKEFTFPESSNRSLGALKGFCSCSLRCLPPSVCPFAVSGHLSSAVGKKAWKWTVSHLVSTCKIS